MSKIEVCLEIENTKDFDLFSKSLTLSGDVIWAGVKGQMGIRGEAEEALANIIHLLNDEAIEAVKEIAPNFCKEQHIE